MKNVLTVRMLSSSQRVTGSLYQYDYGQILLVKDLPLPDWYEVHFCNAGDKETVTAIGDSEGVLIPDSLLKTGNDIVAYIYLHEDETDGETEYQIRIPVIRRPQPTDIEPTPEEQSTIDQLVIAMNDAVSSASQDAETAEQAKDEAVTAKELADSARLVAELARDAAEEAQSAAENALASAERAKTEADTAASSAASYANESANSSSQAASSARAAAESATAAAESAENAERSAASIIGSVDIATQKASEAEQSAAEAATSAKTASTKASEAASSATTANEKAEGAAASESAALQSALKAEGYAVGQQYGVEAASGPYYENNAQYFRDQAQSASASATSSAGAASQSASNAEQKAVEAGQSAASASQSALLASQSSEDAEQSAAAALESETVAGQHSSNAERSASNALQSATEAAESAESAELSATSAQQSSTNAVQSATSSRQSADEAALSAAGANQSAEAAEQSAESAEQSKLSAGQSATNAENSATSASQSAQTATNKASEAASSASTATTKAGEAAQSATSAGTDALKAEGYAVGKQNGTTVSSGTYFHNNSQYYSEQAASAKNAAVVAKDRAETVAGSIETAGQAQISAIEAKGAEVKGSIPLDYTEMSEAIVDANNAVQDVVIVSQTQPQSEDNKLWIKDGGAEEFTIPTYEEFNNLNRALNEKAPVIVSSASGAIASFPDGADDMPIKSLKVGIEPVQDLHGYDSPWPAGGGKNLINIDSITLSAAGNWASYKELDKPIPAGTYTFAVTTSAQSAWNVNFRDENRGLVGQGASATNIQGRQSVTITLTGTATMIGGYLNAPATMSNFQLESGSTATAYAPYSNICPITGWTGAKVQKTGKNLLNKGLLKTGPGSNVRYAAYGVDKYNSQYPNHDLFLTSGDYTFSISGVLSTAAESIAVYNADNVRQKIVYNNKICSFSVSKDGYYKISVIISTALFTTWDNYDLQLEIGSTVTAYEPYQGQTYDINWESEAGTVYGGTLDVTTGTLVVDRAEVDLGTLNWIYSSSGGRSLFTSLGLANRYKPSGANNIPVNAMFECYSNVAMYSTFKNGEAGLDGNISSRIVVCDNRYTDAVTFKTAMSGVQLVYELAEPQTYQLTPIEIRTLLGQNNIWADTGDVIVEYPADTKAYVDGHGGGVQIEIDSSLSGTSTNPVQNKVIKTALDGKEPKHDTITVSGTTPSITGVADTRYVCGEVSTLTIVPPASGCIDVVFTSGTTPTVLTVTPPTGMTMKWANGFDPTSLDADTVYEINILDGCLGVAGSWT